MKPKCSLPHSQEPATCPLSQINPVHVPHPTSSRFILILYNFFILFRVYIIYNYLIITNISYNWSVSYADFWQTDSMCSRFVQHTINPLNPELNPICYLLALLGAHHFLHVSRIRVYLLTFRLLISYIYGAPILDVSRLHTTTQHSR